jgi:uncharacterized protein (TIGR02466 family)
MKQTNARQPDVVVRNLFAMPIVVCRWPDAQRLNAELRETIMNRFRTSPGVVISNRKGWHSKFDLHEWPEPCVAEFMEMVQTAARQMVQHALPDAGERYLENWQVTPAWANVNPAGAHNRSHHHLDGGAHFSGLYYVDIGECEGPIDRGCTIFEDRSGVAQPSEPSVHPLSREYALVPAPGTMALFPSSQYHYVEPYRGKGVRVTIAFNLYHPEFHILYYPGMQSMGWWWKNFRGLMILKEKIPEKAHALSLFASYAAKELREPHSEEPLGRRLKVVYERASVDASAATDAKLAPKLPVKKRLLVE